MDWTLPNADAIMILRCREASSQRGAICKHPALRHVLPDQQHPEDDLGYLQN
jgi:hypothetical protein